LRTNIKTEKIVDCDLVLDSTVAKTQMLPSKLDHAETNLDSKYRLELEFDLLTSQEPVYDVSNRNIDDAKHIQQILKHYFKLWIRETRLSAITNQNTLKLYTTVFYTWQTKFLQNQSDFHVSKSFNDYNLKRCSIKTWISRSKFVTKLVAQSKNIHLGKIFRHWQSLIVKSKIAGLRYNTNLKTGGYIKWRRLLQQRRLNIAVMTILILDQGVYIQA
jgi:hypothetical protein